MEDNKQRQVISEGEAVDLAYKLEWLRVGQNSSLGTEPLKIKKKEKVKSQLSRGKFQVERVMSQTLN